jgi:serine/threonine protein kinase
VGFDNLKGLSFGQALSHVRNAYERQGRKCAGAQAFFATVGQLLGIRYDSVQRALQVGIQRHEHFIGDKSLKDFSKTPLTQGELLGKGGCGKVYAGKAGDTDVIIKTGIDPGDQEGMRIEFERSEELRRAVDEHVHDPETDFARLQGFGGVVTVLGKGPNGSIVQERIHGNNLFDALKTPASDSPYDASGYPKDLQGAKQRTLEFAAEMMSIHAARRVHCDMKSRNLMLDQEGHLCVIDLGGVKNIGDGIEVFSPNSGPEFTSKMRQYELIEEEMDALKEEFNTLGTPLERKTAIKTKLDELKITCDNLMQELLSFKVSPSYDIYSEGTVLPAILFGKAGLDMSLQFYEGSSSPSYHDATKDMDYEDRTEYFKAAFTQLNNDMRATTGQGYSEEEIQKMSELTAWMIDPEPTHRPTSEQVFTHLMELNNISTAEEENIRAGQKHRDAQQKAREAAAHFNETQS